MVSSPLNELDGNESSEPWCRMHAKEHHAGQSEAGSSPSTLVQYANQVSSLGDFPEIDAGVP